MNWKLLLVVVKAFAVLLRQRNKITQVGIQTVSIVLITIIVIYTTVVFRTAPQALKMGVGVILMTLVLSVLSITRVWTIAPKHMPDTPPL